MINDKQTTLGIDMSNSVPAQPMPMRRPRLRAQRNDGPVALLVGSDKRAARQEAEQQRQVDEARTRESMREEPAPPSMYVENQDVHAALRKQMPDLLAWLSTMSSLLGRHVTAAIEVKPDRCVAETRCRACLVNLQTPIGLDWRTSLAHAIRWTYDSHRCDASTLTKQLHDCTADELTQLHADLENESVRVNQRIVDVEKHLGLRKADGTKDDGR